MGVNREVVGFLVNGIWGGIWGDIIGLSISGGVSSTGGDELGEVFLFSGEWHKLAP